jgi:tetratricopeptide (TPR) repeat protein
VKSGLWILIAVIAAGIIVGSLLKGRLDTVEEADETAKLREIGRIDDPEEKVDRLEGFILSHPESGLKARAYAMLTRELVTSLKDTARFYEFAREKLDIEDDAESRAIIYYRIYHVEAESNPETAAGVGRSLLDEPIDVGWIYNYIGYDLAERDRDLDLALRLCGRALELAESADDSASYLDSRGWVFYRQGDYGLAVADLEMARDLYSEPYEEVLRHLAYAALKGRQDEKVFDAFRSILVMGEYDYARDVLDSLMADRGWRAKEIAAFEESVWEARLANAQPAEGFELPSLGGEAYTYDASQGGVSVINFMSPT